MKKVLTILIVIFSIFLLTSCKEEQNNPDDSKIYLDSKFYNKSEFIKLKADEFEKVKDSAFVLYTYNSFCSLAVPCENIFKETMDKYDLTFYSMGIWEAQNTYVYNTVKYAPSIIIIKDKKVIAYLDAESDEDLIKYQDSDEFEKWLDKYIHLKK